MINFKNIIRHILVGSSRFIDIRGFKILNEMERLQKTTKYSNPLNLIPYGKKIYSQNDEDGIIIEIFKRIGTNKKKFIEFGCGNGIENNTYALLFQGWNGLWLDGSLRKIKKIKKNLPKTISSGKLIVKQAFITKENINKLLSDFEIEDEIDLLSIDIDGNDAHIFEAITCIKPRVIIIEYNARFIPPVKYCVNYSSNFTWDWSDNGGASIKYLELLAFKKGYKLVACNLSGVNAFFIRDDLVEKKFEAPFTAEKHYEPARPYISKIKSGHPASFKTLEESEINK